MASKLRTFLIIIIFSLFSFLGGLTISRHIYLGGPLAEKYEIQIVSLSEILPNIYHLIKNPLGVELLFLPDKKTYNEDKFNVPGLYSYLTKDGWVILDKSEKQEIIIPINWEKIKDLYYKNCTKGICVNSKFAAAPVNPLKIDDNIVFHLGGVLFSYNLKNKKFIAFEGLYHHSIEPFKDSLIYACSFGIDTLNIKNDEIILRNIFSGKVIYKKSIANILIKNNLKSLLLGFNKISPSNKDLIHVNDIQPVRKNTNFAEFGDLFLSFRNISTVILYRPSIDSVLWYSTGPWLNQHDVDILNDDMIGIYNNNNIRRGKFLENTYSNITTYNFKTKKFGTLHEKVFKDLEIQSIQESRFEILNDGNMFVEDSPSGMFYLISKEGSLISSKNFPYDKNTIIKGIWARPYTTKKY
jgi:hypothetical protein